MATVDAPAAIAYNRLVAEEVVPRDEVRTALEARRELGKDYEDELVESFAQRIEERLQKGGRLAKREAAGEDRRGISFVVACVSLGTGIPITAIASSEGLAGILAAWAGIAAVNFFASRAR